MNREEAGTMKRLIITWAIAVILLNIHVGFSGATPPALSSEPDITGYQNLKWGDNLESVKQNIKGEYGIREKDNKIYLDYKEAKDNEEYIATAMIVNSKLFSVVLYNDKDKLLTEDEANNLVKSYMTKYGKPSRKQHDAAGAVLEWQRTSGKVSVGLSRQVEGKYRPWIYYQTRAKKR
jgi:hypothetical protein